MGRSKDQESAAGTHSARRNQRNTVAVERNSGEEIRRPGGVLERAFGGNGGGGRGLFIESAVLDLVQ